MMPLPRSSQGRWSGPWRQRRPRVGLMAGDNWVGEQNDNIEGIFSSFAAANPGGLAQMVSLGSGAAGLGMVLRIEDIAVGLAQSDRNFNDLLVKVTGVSVPIF